MNILDIVNLIETNPITKLSSDYNVKLLSKIKDNFTDMEQQLFLSSFYCYLNYHPTNDFVIDLDTVWKWLKFSTKQKALMLLEKNFTLNFDYIKLINLHVKQDLSEKKHGGHNKQNFMLNIKTFKLFCLLADTKKAKEIHSYFIKLEDLLYEILEEESKELKQKLSLIENNSLLEKQKAIEQTLINQFPVNTECVYFGKIDDTNESNETLLKFGHTNNLYNRVIDHRKNYKNFILLDVFKVQNKVEIENCIKCHPKIKKQIRTIHINEKNKTEIISYNNDHFTIEKLTRYIKDIIQEKLYNIDNFNKLLKENEDLLKENEELKDQLKKFNESVVKKTLDINKLNENLQLLENKLQLFEKESQSVYNNPLLLEDEQTNKFNTFIDTMCIVRTDVEESSTILEGSYRIWNKIKPTKEVFHSFKHYLDTRFKPMRLSIQNKKQVVNGYKGVKLRQNEYKKRFINNDVETFLFQVCDFTPSGKILNSTLLSEYHRWKQSVNKEIDSNDIKFIKEYLNSSEHVVRSTVWTDKGSNEGYYGISLKVDEYKHKNTSSTGKKVEKIELSTGVVLGSWETIAKAAESELISAAKMSRSIKNKIGFNDYYYKCQN
jgi:phage anti-repressor protein